MSIAQFSVRVGGRWRAAITLALAVVIAATVLPRPAAAQIGSWLVFDLKSGRVIDQSGAYRPWYPASLTKLMTAYVTFSAIRAGRLTLSSPVVVSHNAASEPPSKMGFKVGSVMTVDAALKMIIVKSANDIAVALGESVSGSEQAFVAEMNRMSRKLGLSQTRWSNPNGLPDNSMVSSARDLGLLARALLNEFPQYRGYFAIQAIRVGKRTMRAHNPLLGRVQGVNGMKTGFICNSGLNLIASATRGGRTIIAVILGARSGLERAAIAKHLVEKGFRSSSGGFSAQTITRLRRPAAIGSLPPQRYCRKVTRPKFEELAARYGTTQSSPNPTLAGISFRTDEPGRIILDHGATTAKSKKSKKKNRKEKRRDVVTALIGPDIYRTKAVQVSLGLPEGAPPVKPRVSPEGTVYVGGVPLPRANPFRGRWQARAPAEPAAPAVVATGAKPDPRLPRPRPWTADR